MGLWFAAAFTLFSAMITKFHHYIFPAVPPAAMLIGLVLDRMLRQRAAALGSRAACSALRERAARAGAARARRRRLCAATCAASCPRGLPSTARRDLGRRSIGWPRSHCAWRCSRVGALVVRAASAARSAACASRQRRRRASRSQPRAMGAALIGGRRARRPSSVAISRGARRRAPPGDERLIHLFVYNYGRPWPEQLRLPPDPGGLRDRRAWPSCSRARCAAAQGRAVVRCSACRLAFTVWCLDVYMVDLSPHWGQRELVQRYYEERKGRPSRSSPGR